MQTAPARCGAGPRLQGPKPRAACRAAVCSLAALTGPRYSRVHRVYRAASAHAQAQGLLAAHAWPLVVCTRPLGGVHRTPSRERTLTAPSGVQMPCRKCPAANALPHVPCRACPAAHAPAAYLCERVAWCRAALEQLHEAPCVALRVLGVLGVDGMQLAPPECGQLHNRRLGPGLTATPLIGPACVAWRCRRCAWRVDLNTQGR